MTLNCFWRSFDQSLAKFQPWFLFPRLPYFFTTFCVAFFVALITLNWCWKKTSTHHHLADRKKDFPHWIVMLEKQNGEYGAPYHDGYHLYILANNQPKYWLNTLDWLINQSIIIYLTSSYDHGEHTILNFRLPSAKRLHNYEKLPCCQWVVINYFDWAIFNS